VIAPYNSPEREKLMPALRDNQGYWTGVYRYLEVVGYSTSFVPAANVRGHFIMPRLLHSAVTNISAFADNDRRRAHGGRSFLFRTYLLD
jgi:hypothetical protein